MSKRSWITKMFNGGSWLRYVTMTFVIILLFLQYWEVLRFLGWIVCFCQ